MKLEQIREERHIEGMEVLSPQWLTLLSEVFRAQPDPDRIHIIMSHPRMCTSLSPLSFISTDRNGSL